MIERLYYTNIYYTNENKSYYKDLDMKKIVCGKFDNIINFEHILKRKYKKVRIGSINPNKLEKVNYSLIATDGNNILFDDKIFNIRDFFLIHDDLLLKNLIVLTFKERELILEESVDFNIEVKVFEKLFPIFDNIKYNSNIYINYEILSSSMMEVEKMNFKGKSLSDHLSKKYLYQIERKLRFKNTMDSCFFFAYKGGYQEVFKLKEEREDRIVIAMDFNSMYPHSMLGEFVNPKEIKYKYFENENNQDISSLHYGLYHIIFKKPKDSFFKNFHPFKYTKFFQSFDFSLEDNHEIELLLFKNELEYYSKFFSYVKIIEGFFSKETIIHPLKNKVMELYNDRIRYKYEANHLMANLTKFKLITLHSASNPKKYKKKWFNSKENLKEYLKKYYMVNIPEDDTDTIYIKNQENFKTFKYKNKYLTSFINYSNFESIYCLSSQIIANSRLKMISTIEEFLQFDSLEICYCNIDSIHISIQKNKYQDFMNKYEYLLSKKLGDLKIEYIANKGYWFDIGRYWLIKDSKDIKFKNVIFNRKGNNSLFLKNTKLKYVVKNNFFNYVKIAYKNVYSSFSYNKKLDYLEIDNINFKRYNFTEIENLFVANQTKNKEALKSKKIKVDLFNKIATV